MVVHVWLGSAKSKVFSAFNVLMNMCLYLIWCLLHMGSGSYVGN